MTKHTFNVEPRSTFGRQVKKLLTSGIASGNVFGKNVASKSIQFSSKEFQKLIKGVGESSLLYLQVKGDSSELPVLIRDLDYHPVTNQLRHVSFQQVSLKEKASATVPLLLSGDAPAVSQGLGILVQSLDEVEVEALPTDIPENFTLNVTNLAAVGDSITVADLKLNPSVFTLVTDYSTIIVQISPLAKEEKAETPAAPAEGETPAAPAEATSEDTATPPPEK